MFGAAVFFSRLFYLCEIRRFFGDGAITLIVYNVINLPTSSMASIHHYILLKCLIFQN